MRITLLLHICVATLLCAAQVFSAEPMLDFDGRGGNDKDLKTFVAENALRLPPWREEAETELIIKLSASTAPFHSAPSPIIFPEMQGNTTYYYWIRFPVFSTRIVTRFDSYRPCRATTLIDYINVEVQGLEEMPYGDNYYLDNSQDAGGYHPDAHYGSQKLIDTLTTVANKYKAVSPNSERLGIQDMSLPWGGVFDLNYDWKEPHYGHTIGADADINRAAVPQENRQKLLEIMCGLTPGVFLERDIPGEPPHYHLRVYGGTELRLDDFMANDARALSCCKGNVVDPANLQTCISARN